MSFLIKNKKLAVVLAGLFVFSAFLTTCDSPLGFGKIIDFEPPVLTLDPVPNPLYVRLGSVITGTVSDNVAVDRVIMIDTVTGKELFKAAINGENWIIELVFSPEQNGEKIMAQISAYDTSGNCGAPSIAFVTMIIDIRPPIVENITIQRTDTRVGHLEPLAALKHLETTDPRGERKNELYSYQNGWFYISGVVNDEETKIEIVSLDFYDVREINKKIISLPVDEGYSKYFPRWTVKEENIINAGKAIWGEDYKTNYYNAKERYYYRVIIKAIDMSENENSVIEEDEGYICMWAKSDEPKGILDPVMGTVVTRGIPLPIDFYDDDSIEWAYAGLFTQNQWYSRFEINSGVYIPDVDSNEQKLEWLKDYLTKGGKVFNWRYEKYGETGKDAAVVDQIEGKTLDEKLYYVPTGNNENDYGQYILFTLTADKKLSPHDGKGPESTNIDTWTGRVWTISVIDENAPLIVFDVENGCPEENTFPSLSSGENFSILGYTLRENKTGRNSVEVFRMAWIPFGMDGGPDRYIIDVQNALAKKESAVMPAGVQYWDISLESKGNESIDTNEYLKQTFTQSFSVLKDFFYNGKLENETKLFIFFAMDNMGHEVFRQLRLLGMKTPPSLTVYDITNKLVNSELTGMPDPNDVKYVDTINGGLLPSYYAELNTYNKNAYAKLNRVSVVDDDKTVPFQIYPRGTIIKYLVEAAKTGEIAVNSITMTDVTFSGDGKIVGSNYDDKFTQNLSFCEYYPDVTQRTFMFEAEDQLGNKAQIQRTIAVTNAARLENITTTEQSGLYGKDRVITLKANFSSQIYVVGGSTVELNVRYKDMESYVYEKIPCANIPDYNSPSLSLDFNFTVPERANDFLFTVYDDPSFNPDYSDKRPIILGGNTKIMDYLRNDAAFIPGYQIDSVFFPNWTTDTNSLQKNKLIQLDGTPPSIVSVTADGGIGKNVYELADPYGYFFKTGETINFTLKADKSIRANGTPVLRYYIREVDGTRYGPFDTAFKYKQPGANSTELIFSLPVTPENFTYGGILRDRVVLVDVSLFTADGIKDNADNNIVASSLVAHDAAYIKQNPPNAPIANINPIASNAPDDLTYIGRVPNTVLYYKGNPTLTLTGNGTWENITEYSINGGISWLPYPTAPLILTNGTYRVQARFEDRAGNKGVICDQAVQVEGNFPRLVMVNTVEPNGWYKSDDTLTFNLVFEDTVNVYSPANVSITLTNGNDDNTHNTDAPLDGEYKSYQKHLTADNSTPQTDTTVIKFSWKVSGKEMQDGLYISGLNLSGLRDRFGNTGPENVNVELNASIKIGDNTCPNLPVGGIKIDAIAPKYTISPAAEGVSTDNRTIKLEFNEEVMTGSGTITLKPREGYRIPAVLEDNGYYLDTDGKRYTSPQSDINGKTTTTWVAGFYDIYNSLGSTDRNYLTQGTSMSNLTLDYRTGQNVGPYVKMTHGLKEGAGFTGNYSDTTPGANGPNPEGTDRMIPDTATKWVLDYRYSITGNDYNTPYVNLSDELTNADTAVIGHIRTALTNAKWRWQEMDLVSSVSLSPDKKTVTITLNEPLLVGLQWELAFPEGAFTDAAGNNAAASPNAYWFWSNGVQTPVIRVDRKSFDARKRQAPVPAATSGTFNNLDYSWIDFRRVYSVPENKDGRGWGIGDFNTVYYKVETETPDAAIYYDTRTGTTDDGGSITGAWTGTISGTRTWDNITGTISGVWVLKNLVLRSGSTSYTVQENGINVTRTVTTNYHGYRSYNRDILKSDLITVNDLTTGGGAMYEGSFTYTALQASKNYVVAQAKRGTNNSEKGYEGVFRSVIALNQASFGANLRGNNLYRAPTVVQGSNIKNGMPSVAGFPVRDAEETGDNRFIKLFYYEGYTSAAAGNTNLNSAHLYWISTEIVSQWYNINCSKQNQDNTSSNATNNIGSHQGDGDVNNYLYSGYGDLSYAYNLR